MIQSRLVAEQHQGFLDCLSLITISGLGLALLFLSAFTLFWG